MNEKQHYIINKMGFIVVPNNHVVKIHFSCTLIEFCTSQIPISQDYGCVIPPKMKIPRSDLDWQVFFCQGHIAWHWWRCSPCQNLFLMIEFCASQIPIPQDYGCVKSAKLKTMRLDLDWQNIFCQGHIAWHWWRCSPCQNSFLMHTYWVCTSQLPISQDHGCVIHPKMKIPRWYLDWQNFFCQGHFARHWWRCSPLSKFISHAYLLSSVQVKYQSHRTMDAWFTPKMKIPRSDLDWQSTFCQGHIAWHWWRCSPCQNLFLMHTYWVLYKSTTNLTGQWMRDSC
jgi:hypothetical protein